MVPGSQHARSPGPALIRSLARLTELEGPASSPDLAERLSQWLRWTDAVSLSAALNASPATPSGAPDSSAGASAADREFARVRAVLAKAIAEDELFAPDLRRADPSPDDERRIATAIEHAFAMATAERPTEQVAHAK